jgi:hypothetical protein
LRLNAVVVIVVIGNDSHWVLNLVRYKCNNLDSCGNEQVQGRQLIFRLLRISIP